MFDLNPYATISIIIVVAAAFVFFIRKELN